MNFKIDTKLARNTTIPERIKLSDLTFGGRGYMRGQFRHEFYDPKSEAIVTVAKARNGVILGWALAFKQHHSCKASFGVYFYVKQNHRRKGIGTALLEAVRESIADIQVYPHDEASRVFFANHRNDVAITAEELRAIERAIAA